MPSAVAEIERLRDGVVDVVRRYRPPAERCRIERRGDGPVMDGDDAELRAIAAREADEGV